MMTWTRIKIVLAGAVVAPPAVLMQDVPEPKLRGKTNADLAAWAVEMREALRLANHDKHMLRKWGESRKE